MQQFQLWTIGSIYKEIKLAKPKLASWNANTDPEQITLQRYLNDIKQKLHPLPQGSGLFLHMEIDVEDRAHLLHHHDLDNYLYPVVNQLGASRFKLVSATKRVGGGSYLRIGQTKLTNTSLEKDGWVPFFHYINGPSIQKPEWKHNIRNALKVHQVDSLKSGAVELHLVWKCSSQRNWTSLWKPTIDSMGPILGEPNPNRPFHPNDDRIVSLTLHLNTDNTLGWSVHIGMLWRSIMLQ
jgi:hypothetical protein